MANLRTNNLSGEQGQNAYRGSVQFNDADYLQIADSADIEFGSNDYTVEFWAIFSKKTSSTDYEEIVNKGYPFQIYRYTANDNIALAVDSNTGTYEINDTFGTPSRGDWHHIAVSRSGNTTRAFVNGIQGLSSTSNTSIHDGSSAFTIGTYGASTGSYQFRGVISNVRVVIGTALYTADFTPPREELTIVDGTAILCCQDSDDPTQEATGKTITGFGDLATAGYLKTQPKVIPPYGVDAGNAFGGPIQQSTQGYMCFPTGRTEERGRGRGVLSGGRNDHAMQFVNIQSQGNSQTFGDSITGDGIEGFAVGSSTRGLFSGGYPSVGNVIEFITFATTSNGKDFGDMTTGRRSGAGAGNETRGLFGGGLNSSGTTLNTIEFSTIASLGNSTDFGDMTQARDQLAGLSDTTRAIFAGGVEQGGSQHNIMDFVTIATTGNAQDFGDTSAINHGSSASSDSTRGVIALAYTAPNMINTIEFITIQSAGNSKDFGDLTQAGYLSANMSNSTRAVIAGRGTPSASNTIDFVTIQTTGNANDFGDLIGGANFVVVGTSDSHGGLS